MDDMIPQDHLLRIIDKAIDWNFIYDLVVEKYSQDTDPQYGSGHVIQYEQNHLEQRPEMSENDYFDKYIKIVTTSYDSEEFERTRELFEGIFPDSLDDELGY